MALIQFRRSVETAAFFSPLASMEWAEQTIEVRRDPLTGMTAVSSSELATKEQMFYGTTDWAYAEKLAADSRDGCFFCPEKVMATTPRYPDDLVIGGRLQRGRALVFPNLFPLAALHAVVTYPELHFLRPSQFTADLLEEGLGAAVDFVGRAEQAAAAGDPTSATGSSLPPLEHIELCCNHMLPAGASMAHPHFQVFGGPAVPWLVAATWERAEAFKQQHNMSYWQTLVDEETERGERFIASRAGCTWLAPFAPTGGREVIAVLPGFARVSELGEQQVAALAAGLAQVLAWYEGEGLSAFNFTLSGGPPSDHPTANSVSAGRPADSTHAVVLRIVARSAFKPDYRTDDYFLQKQLGGELIFVTPEQIATTLRPRFAAS
jgi:galactose-1-phosphate uridylyltransferase